MPRSTQPSSSLRDKPSSRYQILLIEDNPDGGLLLEHALESEPGFHFQIHHVERVTDGVQVRKRYEVDVVLLDLGLVETRGLDTLRAAQEALPDLPIIVLTGNDDVAMGLTAVKAGAEDYIVKGHETAREITRCIRYARERHLHVEEIRAVNADLKRLLDERLAELRRAQQRAARNDRMAAVGTIAAGVAHELNSPLMGVINHIQYVLAKLPGHETRLREVLAGGLDYTRRCVSTIDSLLQHAREHTDGAQDRSPTTHGNVSYAVDRAIEDVRSLLYACGTMIKTELPETLPVVSLDQSSLEIVLRNLLRNACEALEGSSSRSIRLSARHDERQVEISVHDTGCGLPAGDLERAFEPLYTTRPGLGNGIGLALCKRLVEGAGGYIFATKSEPGSVFTVALPLAAAPHSQSSARA